MAPTPLPPAPLETSFPRTTKKRKRALVMLPRIFLSLVHSLSPCFFDEQSNVHDGIFCSSCISVGEQVINLGCNATSSEIANLCGNLFVGVCKTVLGIPYS